jgi:hypothetical protein
MVLGERVAEEVEIVRDILAKTLINGFYSYGEISPANLLEIAHCITKPLPLPL